MRAPTRADAEAVGSLLLMLLLLACAIISALSLVPLSLLAWVAFAALRTEATIRNALCR